MNYKSKNAAQLRFQAAEIESKSKASTRFRDRSLLRPQLHHIWDHEMSRPVGYNVHHTEKARMVVILNGGENEDESAAVDPKRRALIKCWKT